MNNKRGRPRQYLRLDEWQKWLNEQWLPFKNNEFSHLIRRVDFQDAKVNFILGFSALILALLAILVIKVL